MENQLSLFALANEREEKQKQEKIKMDTPLKVLDENKKEAIRKKHWELLNQFEAMLLPTDVFSSYEKHELLTDFQNKIDNSIDAEIYIQETKLNK